MTNHGPKTLEYNISNTPLTLVVDRMEQNNGGTPLTKYNFKLLKANHEIYKYHMMYGPEPQKNVDEALALLVNPSAFIERARTASDSDSVRALSPIADLIDSFLDSSAKPKRRFRM